MNFSKEQNSMQAKDPYKAILASSHWDKYVAVLDFVLCTGLCSLGSDLYV